MKSIYKTLLIGITAFIAIPMTAQETALEPEQETVQAAQNTENSFFDGNGGVIDSNLPTSIDLSERKPIEYNNPRTDDVRWQQVVYRIIDLREKINFPLYFPILSSDHRQSLFTTIFRLHEQGKIKGFEYEDTREIFTKEKEVKFDDILKKYGVMITYNIDSLSGDTLGQSVDEVDIPNRDVIKYYLKEVWYFDKNNSTYNVRILAICPKIYTMNNDGALESNPIAWYPFDMLRPYLAQQEALLTDANNGARETMDDLFIKRKFGSYIYKMSNTRNRNLIEYNINTEEAHKEQNRIKTMLINYEQDLWEY